MQENPNPEAGKDAGATPDSFPLREIGIGRRASAVKSGGWAAALQGQSAEVDFALGGGGSSSRVPEGMPSSVARASCSRCASAADNSSSTCWIVSLMASAESFVGTPAFATSVSGCNSATWSSVRSRLPLRPRRALHAPAPRIPSGWAVRRDRSVQSASEILWTSCRESGGQSLLCGPPW